MPDVPRSPLPRQLTGGLAVPRLTRLGLLTIVLGLAADLFEHAVLVEAHAHTGDGLAAGFSAGEHLAHLLVLLGMVLVLVGVLVDGTRDVGRVARPERSPRDALR